METKMDFITKKGVIKRLLTMALGLIMAVIACVTVLPGTEMTVKAAGTGKNLQIVSGGSVPNIEGAQISNIYFGNYMQSGDGAGGFSVDPIKWRVLQNSGGQLFLLADKALDGKKYNEYGSATWESCTLRTWLNGDFMNSAFSGAEILSIADSSVINSDNPDDGTSGGNDTMDKLFLLSIAEYTNTSLGFAGNYNYNDDARKAIATDYAVHNGAVMYSGVGSVWWLRSPGGDVDRAAVVLHHGDLFSSGLPIANVGTAVRPAFDLNLSSVIYTSAAVGGKSSGTVGADALTSVADYTGTDWKVTLLDDGSINSNLNGHAGFTATRVGGGNVAIGDEITLSFGGAQTGSNEYVSAIIVSAADETTPLYYGRIANNTASDTAATVKVPTGISDGDYKLLVFAEQYNGDKKTDFASAYSEIDFTVEGAGNVASTPRPVGGNASSSDSSLDLDTEEETTGDYLDELMVMLEAAIASGTEKTINWSEGTALPGPVMKILEENPQITLVFSYTYQGLDYRVTLPGKYVKYDPKIPWCGPLYLYGLYGKYGTNTNSLPKATTSRAGERTYTVISGETLWGIAMRLGTTVEELVRLNNIPNPDRIDIGQIIRY
ncbi:LysM domain-containing protein [Lachnospiraceae bacterium G11]|nr:LysM domain-containing protein [Lachnospiraceae bacterium G11]